MLILDKLAVIAVYTPFIGFLISIAFNKFKTISITTPLVGMSIALLATLLLLFHSHGDYESSIIFFEWINLSNLKINCGLQINSLNLTMIVVVNVVSFLVHIYSLGYMAHDHAKHKFMSYLSFFTFMMLVLITAPNMIQLFLGWEGVGLSSYLLIGFWSEKTSAANASMKAFVVNRIGDAGLIIAMAFFLYHCGTLDFDYIQTAFVQHKIQNHMFYQGFYFNDLVCMCLIIGAMGKSAQFGLHIWLPDAMEGPTPVSALIHAATMVTAGVFLIVKFGFLFEMAPFAKQFLVYLGIITAFFAGTVALAQNDIKRIIAYSTCSQLGYMVASCGAGAYKAATFHLVTHAFFKALLFLGAGSVIHAMSDEQNITKMGGIKNLIPTTYTFMWIGTLALIGAPFFAGYYSKEAILHALYHNHQIVPYIIGLGVVILTSFYSLRLMILVFHGKNNANEHVMAHVHESPLTMLIPLGILSIGAIFSGYFGEKLFMNEAFFNWRSSILTPLTPTEHGSTWWLNSVAIGCVTFGSYIAYLKYSRKPQSHNPDSSKNLNVLEKIYVFLQNKWYIDELYEKIICKPCDSLATFVWQTCDLNIIDRFGPNGLTKLFLKLSGQNYRIQTGYVYHYALIMILGILLFSLIFVTYIYLS